jgi:DNA-binding beta-propeller fold protein YncE
MRKRIALIGCAFAAMLGLAGCSGQAARAVTQPARSSPDRSSPAPPLTALASPGSLASPGCSTASAVAATLDQARTAMTPVAGNPFGVAVTSDSRWAFVAQSSAARVEVMRVGPALSPAAVRSITLPGNAQPLGETLTRDGRYLLVASDDGAVVLSVQRAERGSPGAVLGTLQDRHASGAIEVAVSPDGGYAFVTEEDSHAAAVFNLRFALAHGFGPGSFVGTIPLGLAPVGMAVSPDGRWLYATSEEMPGAGPAGPTGSLSIISLPRAETDPSASVEATVRAGCSPVRVITSAHGSQVWVTARESDDLLCFSASLLRTDPAHALTAIVRVGEAPVGLMLVRDGTRMVVADSNRFGAAGATSNLAVVKVASGREPALLGYLPAGLFPREMALEPGGKTLLVTNYASSQLEAVNVTTLP